MSSVEVENLSAAIQILGIHLVKSSSEFWTPSTMEFKFDFQGHSRSLDADIVLAPLTSVLKYEDDKIEFHHSSFAEFLLDHTRSSEFFVHPKKWQKWIVARFVPVFYGDLPHDLRQSFRHRLLNDVQYLIKEAKPGTELQQAINDGLALVANRLPSGGDVGILPFVTYAFFAQLQLHISIDVRLHSAYHTES